VQEISFSVSEPAPILEGGRVVSARYGISIFWILIFIK